MLIRSVFTVVALVVLFAIWLTGSPPAISAFWDRAEVTVIRHDMRPIDSVSGLTPRMDPIVEVTSGSPVDRPILLLVRAADAGATVERWPLGLTLQARIAPNGSVAYPSDWWPSMLIPAIAMTILFGALAFVMFRPFFEKRWRSQNGPAIRKDAGLSFRPIAFVFGLIFIGVPLLLAYFFWTFGDPPAYSIAWTRLDMQIASSNVRRHQVGNGTVAAYVDVMVLPPDSVDNGGEELRGITWGWISIPDAEELREARYMPGETVRAMVSPAGDYYVVRWRFPDFLALFIIPLALVSVPVGLFAMKLAFS